MELKPNSDGLYDSGFHAHERERVSLSQEDIEKQLDAGAFMIDLNDAVARGFINPEDYAESVIVEIRR